MISGSLVKYVLTAALRDKMVLSILLIAILGTSLSIFLGSSAVIESDQFALVFTGGSLRFASAAGLVLFVAFYIRRLFDSRDVDFLLSRPLSRLQFILSHALALSILAIIVGLFMSLAVVLVAPHQFGAGTIYWSISLLLELIIIANTCLFFAMVLSSAVSAVLATGGFYILARLMGELIGIVDTGSGGNNIIIRTVFEIIALIIPRLDLMAQTSWLVYGYDNSINLAFIGMQFVGFMGLAVCAALIDLIRRQF